MSLRYALILALILAVAGAGGYWFNRNYEKQRAEKDIGFQGEARDNDLLAAQRYFQSFNMAARSVEGLALLPPNTATLIIPGARYEMGAGEAQRLRNWVEAGGHLLVVPSAAFNTSDERQDLLRRRNEDAVRQFIDAPGVGRQPAQGIADGGFLMETQRQPLQVPEQINRQIVNHPLADDRPRARQPDVNKAVKREQTEAAERGGGDQHFGRGWQRK